MHKSKLALLVCVFAGGVLSGAPALAAGESAEAPATPPVAESPAQPTAAATPATGIIIPAGTLIVVETTQPLDTRSVKAGDHFGLRLTEPIKVDGVVVVPAGATGIGEVIDAKPAGIGGRPGRLVLAARYLDSGSLHLTLQSLKLGGGGRDNSGVAVGATIAVGIVGVLIPGGNIEYPVGTFATAKIAAAVTVPPATAEATPSSDPTPKS